jgi:hypothetical protein
MDFPAVRGLYATAVERENIRLRRLRGVPRLSCTDDPIMQRTRICNVRRRDDRTTQSFQEHCDEAVAKWHGGWLHLSAAEQCRLGGLLVFNCALWRAFGMEAFANEVSGVVERWDESEKSRIVEVALSLFKRGYHSYTAAYAPPRICRRVECQSYSAGDESKVRTVYARTCRELDSLWLEKDLVAQKALNSRSLEDTICCLRVVPQFGGTGFRAKEVVLDLLFTPLFQEWDVQGRVWLNACTDVLTWSAIGPGARRGLNRIWGRKIGHGIHSVSKHVENIFLEELRIVYAFQADHWPYSELHMPDVQFWLCEWDKYMRVKTGGVSARRYDSSNEASANPRRPGRLHMNYPLKVLPDY